MSFPTTTTRPPTRPPGFTTLDRAQRVRFRRAVTLIVMTLLLPGSAQLVQGNRRVGRIALRTWLALVVVGALAAASSYLWNDLAFWAGTNTTLLLVVRLALMALAIGWAYLFVDAWRLGQPLTLHRQQRLAVVGVNGFLCFSVAGALLFSAHVVGVQRDFMISMFGNGEAVGAHSGRYNVLLMGGDSGAGRWGLRPDSMTVASVDAETGKTLLISLPRNMQNFPFAEGSVLDQQFPDGFDAEGEYLNSLATWALDHPKLFKGSKTPGIDATIMGIEGITDLKINYWAMVNLDGFKNLVNAVGGVTLNVRQPIPVGIPSDDTFHYIDAGKRELDGMQTLWYARARHGSDDYSRMARQKCVMNAMLQQVSPQTALSNFEDIAKASSEMVSTSVPRSEVGKFVDLAMKAKSQKVATLSLVPPMINTAHPDMTIVHDKVAAAIAGVEGEKPAPADEVEAAPADETEEPTTTKVKKKTPPAAPPAVTGGSVGSLSQGYAANQAEDLGAAC